MAKSLPKRDFKHETWHQFYWDAWNALRYDRPYAGMNGQEMPIHYVAIDRYAQRLGIEGAAFDRLLRFVSAIDDAHRARQMDTLRGLAAKGNKP